MKKVLSILAVAIVIGSCVSTKKSTDPCLQTKHEVDSLKKVIASLEDEIDFWKDEVQWREAEVSYWGRKYDSIKMEVIKK